MSQVDRKVGCRFVVVNVAVVQRIPPSGRRYMSCSDNIARVEELHVEGEAQMLKMTSRLRENPSG